MTYDSACWELARTFLLDSDAPEAKLDKLTHELAQAIQSTIEDFIEAETGPPTATRINAAFRRSR